MVFNNNLLLGAGGQGGAAASFDTTLIGNSIWVDGSGTSGDAMTRTWGSESNQDRWIWSTWYSPSREIDSSGDTNGLFASGIGSNGFYLTHSSSSSQFFIFCRDNAGNEGSITTSESYRDLTAWYHVLVDFDSANAAANDRISLYVNGVRVGAYSGTAIGQNNHIAVNVSGQTAHICQDLSSTPNAHMQGYLAQTVFLDNKSIANGDLAITDFLDTFTFGTNGSQRIPKSNTDIIALASAAGNNSFCLDYSDSSNIVNDASSKGNNFTPTGGGSPTITSANQSVNTPSKVYPIVNALTKVGSAASTLEEGNTKATVNDNGGIVITPTLPFSGLWYFEINVTTNSIWNPGIGQQSALGYNSTAAWNNTTAETHVWLSDHSGNFFNNNGSLSTYPIANPTTGRFAVAWDGDNRALYFGQISGSTITWTNSGDPTSGSSKTGAAPGNWPTTGTDPLYFIVLGGGTSVMEFDFDEDDWTGVTNRPAAAKVLNSANLTAPDFQGIDYFDATIYEGNGTGQRVGDFVPFTDAYTVTNSVMFEDGDSRSLTLNSSATRTSATVAAFSLWTKRGNLGINARPLTVQVDGNNYFSIYYNTSDQLDFTINNGGATILQRITTRAFKDTSAWHNIVVIINQGEGTQADRVKVFYDGVQIANDSTGFGTNTCTLDGSSALNFLDSASAVHDVGGGSSTAFTQAYDGYVAEVAFLDGADSGAKLNASDFGQVDTSTNRWVPKDIGSYNFGNTGYYLEFKVAPGTSNGAGTDTSGESNNFTSNGSWATSDQFTDCPSQNFNVFDGGLNGAGTLSEGNTQIVTTTNARTTYTTMNIPATGKWYWEVDVVNYVSGGSVYIGVVEFDELVTGNDPVNGLTKQVVFDNFAGNAYIYSTSSLGTTWCNTPGNNSFNADGDVLQFALDQDAGKLFIGNNNTWFRAGGARDSFANATTVGQRTFKTGVKRRFLIGRGGSFNETYAINFGQQANTFSGSSTTFNAAADGSFVYTPPTGYKALNQDNLDDTASKITAWAWIKNRDATDPHILVDRVRGVGEVLHSNATDLEATNTNTVQRFFQRGVQVGSDAEVNTANESYVLWQWLVGEAATTTTINASSTTPTNSIASTVAAADAGHFSVVGYQGNSTNGATVAHSLGGEPELIFFRGREGSGASSFLWRVFSTTGGAGKYLRLNDSTALQDDTAYLNNTLPGSVVFTLGTDGDVNNSSYTYIAYCFRSVPGVCKVGSYIGNLNDNGPYISLGFRPRWILLKSTTTARDWVVFDTSRDPTNMADHRLDPSNTGAEFNAALDLDILSDGFKFRSDDIDGNADGVPYIYLAMADIGGNGTLPPIYGR